MKTTYISLAALALMAVVSGSVFAEGSVIQNSTITNEAENNDVQTFSRGAESEASTGAITISGAKVQNSEVTNESDNDDAATISDGYRSKAKTGTIDIN